MITTVRRHIRFWFLALAPLLALARPAFADPVDLPIDEYLCYQAKETKILAKSNAIPGYKKFTGFEFGSKDQFEPLNQRNYLAAKYVNLCNPIDPTANADVHLLELQVKESKAFPNPSKLKFNKPLTVYNLADRLGMVNGVTLNKAKSVMVRVGKTDWGELAKCKVDADCAANGIADDCNEVVKICQVPPVGPLPPVPAAPTNLLNTADYMCYQVKGPKLTFPNQVGVEDQFAFPDDYELKKVTKLCAPTDKAMPNAAGPDASPFAGHLLCYQAKSLKANINPMTGKANKFVKRVAAINGAAAGMPNGDYLEVKKITEMCIPALKAIDPAMPEYETPTTLTTLGAAASGVCGTLTTDLGGGEGVPGRLDPNTGENGNSTCTAASTPLPCCTGLEEGHCNEGTTVTCGSLTFGGGGPSVGNPGSEGGQAAGGQTRYSLACDSPSDTTCAISGNAGDLLNGVNCSTTGCGGVTPVESTSPVKVCALNTLAAPGATGNLNLATGEISLATTTNATVHILTTTSFPDTACPRCRTGTATTDPEVFQTAPGSPGVGVCDSDSVNVGDPCVVFEDADNAGLTTDCEPDIGGGASAVIAIGTTQSTAGASVSDPAGHFCGAEGQGGNSDCTGAGTPQICCSAAGMGSCNNFNGCFGSANAAGTKFADTPAVCTGISVTGSAPGLLVGGLNGLTTYGTISCIPAVNAGVVLSGLVNNNAGLPGPVVTSSKVQFELGN